MIQTFVLWDCTERRDERIFLPMMIDDARGAALLDIVVRFGHDESCSDDDCDQNVSLVD